MKTSIQPNNSVLYSQFIRTTLPLTQMVNHCKRLSAKLALSLFFLMIFAPSIFAQRTVTISSTEPNPTNVVSFQVNIEFSEGPISGFEISEVIVGNGFITNLDDLNNPLFIATIQTNMEGLLTINVGENVCDQGNFAAPQFSIFYDITPPTLDPVSITSNNMDPMYVSVGGVVTLTFTSSETIVSPMVYISGQMALPSEGAGNQWSATYEMTGTETEGTINFTIDFEDLAGNFGTQVIATTDASSVIFDKTEPSGYTANFDQAQIDGSNQFSCSFTISSAEIGASYDFIISSSGGGTDVTNWGEVMDMTHTVSGIDVSGLLDGELTLTVTLKDMAGNVGTPAVNFVTKDTQGGGPIATPPAFGDGTELSPYEIASLENLYWISQNVLEWSKYFIQTANIDATSTSSWNSGEGWMPIGNDSEYFTGTYDGDEHTIDGLFIYRSSDYQGLFGYTSSATIKNINLVNVDIQADNNVGGIVGLSSGSTVTNCHTNGSISGGSNVGGLIGRNVVNSVVENCSSKGTVTASSSNTGGLIGANLSSEVKFSFSEAQIQGSTFMAKGGFIGSCENSTISNSYARGNNVGDFYSGGFIGSCDNSTINFCYSTGSVPEVGSNAMGFIGYASSTTVNNSFWDIETSGSTESMGGIGKTTAEMKALSTFLNAGWDFMIEEMNGTDDFWGINPIENSGYPFLAWQGFLHDETEYLYDIDGNAYPTVVIGDQTWMAKNLRVTRYKNAMSITTNLDNSAWTTTVDGAYAVYPNADIAGLSTDAEVLEAYGALYNWYAVADPQGLCPEGWRVPSVDDWNAIINYVSSIEPTNLGNQLKSCRQVSSPLGGECATSDHPRWDSHATYYGTDDYGFSALPGGRRYDVTGLFSFVGLYGYFWSDTESDMENAYSRHFFYDNFIVNNGNNHKTSGFSVRCMKDIVPPIFSGGSGTEIDPYQISTLKDLDSLSTYSHYWDKYFIQTAHIDATETGSWNSNLGFSPIGNQTTPFSGTYDGGGYTISNLYIDSYTTNRGFFGYASQATISNLGIVDAYISGENNTGAVVGYLDNSTISQTFADAIVVGNLYAGVLVGYSNNASIIENCYAAGEVNGYDVGGIVGYALNTAVTNCYSYASVFGGEGSGGGLIGNSTSTTVTNSFWDTETSGFGYSAGGDGKTTAEMRTLSTYTAASWDFMNETTNGEEDIWGINGGENNGYPFLAWQGFLYDDVSEYIYDIDGNVYPTVVIGNQKWMAKNLRVANYKNSMPITTDLDNSAWSTTTDGAYAVYPFGSIDGLNSDEEVREAYGLLYNWYAVADPQGLCPEGWLVPTDEDWTELTTFLGGGSVAGGKLKSTLTNPDLHPRWESTNTGATDEFGFSAFPGGFRYDDGSWNEIGTGGYFYSSTAQGEMYASIVVLNYSNTNLTSISLDKNYGLSIRCIKEKKFSGGSGTEGDPYLISTLEDLDSLSTYSHYWDKHFLQTADIDASATSTWNSGEGWSPIGIDYNTYFTGIYDGGGHTISELSINRVGDNQGFFGYAINATIKNLGLVSVNITGEYEVGALCGYLDNSQVENCYSSGTINGIEDVGGLAGAAYMSSFLNSFSTCDVSGDNLVGGLLGYGFEPTITNCYTMGSVEATSEAGGLAGRIMAETGQAGDYLVTNSYSASVVNGESDLGGLIGGTMMLEFEIVNNCFWDVEVSGINNSLGGTGKTTAEMTALPIYIQLGWDFKDWGIEGIWNIGNGRNNGYPYLNWQFPTDPGPSAQDIAPLAYTDSVVNVTATSATGYGNIIYIGIPSATDHGFCWNTTGTPTILDEIESLGAVSDTGSFSAEITGLITNTTCYIRAFATNSEGTSYGKEFVIIPVNAPIGDGSSGNPYQISTLYDLYWVQQNPSEWVAGKNFIQTANIDATETSSWNYGEGWMPIGNSENSFSGTYKGGGHIIDGLYINRPFSYENQGFFGNANELTIDSLGLTNVNITGAHRVGALVGSCLESIIRQCFATGTVTGEVYVGGLVGSFDWGNLISDSYSMVSVKGEDYLGGLIGYDNLSNDIYRCYNAGPVIGTMVGGLVGYSGSNSSLYCFWDIESSGLSSSGGTNEVGKTTAEMSSIATFTTDIQPNDWDFINIWKIDSDDPGPATYPYFQWQGTAGNHNYPKGTEGNPYEISTKEELQWLSQNPLVWSKYFVQTDDIEFFPADFEETGQFYNEGFGWSPIGDQTTEFTGTYDGNGHSISGLFVDREGFSSNQGFFGYANNATIKNLSIINAYISGDNNVGILTGNFQHGTIENCHAMGTITGLNYVGGLIGNFFESDIYTSSCDSEVSGNDNVGGLFGYGYNSIITNCYSIGTVSGVNNVGGLVGWLINSTMEDAVVNSYSACSIVGSEGIGGLLGGTGAMMVQSKYSFWDTEASGVTTSKGGIGKTTAEITNFPMYIQSGWDFKGWGTEGIWNIGNDRNDGYPYLDSQFPSDPAQSAQDIAPVAYTDSIKNITGSSATIYGEIFYIGSPAATQHGFCWNTSKEPTIDNDKTELGGVVEPGPFSSLIGPLTANTLYYVRAFAQNDAGVSYGEELSFIPLNEPEGDGTELNPYLITSIYDLLWVQQNPSEWVSEKYFEQTANINATNTTTWNNGDGWMPIGTWDNPFMGNYQGNGFTIDSLFINRNEVRQGLFGRMNYASIAQLALTNVNISGGDDVGSLVGNAEYSDIQLCFTTGAISGGYNIGGIVGNLSQESRVSNCYSMVNVNGDDYVGGLIGYDYYQNAIDSCYSAGLVIGNGTYVGGLVGYTYTSSSLYSFWDTEASGQLSSSVGTGKTTSEMVLQSTFPNWDFINIWKIDIDDPGPATYPYFQWQVTAGEHNIPKGTETNPYEIATLADLKWLSETPSVWGKYFEQTADLVFNETDFMVDGDFYNEGNGFIPIGGNMGDNFSGHYNGNGHTIDGIFMNYDTGYDIGPFGKMEAGGSITNLGITNADINGYLGVAALVGNNSGTISNCFVTGTVIAQERAAGGAAGYNFGTISNSYSHVTVTRIMEGQTNFGSFVGESSNGTIEYSYSTGSVIYDGVADPTDKGFVGYEGSTNTFINNFFDSETSLQTTGTGATAKTTAQMNAIATFTDAGWDFVGETTNGEEDIWEISPIANNGYPFLVWQGLDTTIPAELTTDAVTEVTTTTAKLNGTIISLGDPLPNNHGFCWGVNENPDFSDSYIDKGVVGAVGEFWDVPTELTPGATYFVRAFVQNGAVTTFGEQQSFTTLIEVTIGGTFTPQDKDYDGTLAATIEINNLFLDGVVGGDDVTLDNIVLEFAQIEAGTSMVSIVDATLSGPDAHKYSLSLAGAPIAAGIIHPMKIFITPDAGQGKVYGDADPAEYTFTHSGLIGVDEITGAMERDAGENAGVLSFTLGTLFAGSNYLLEFVIDPATFIISQRPVTVTADAKIKTYGDTEPVLTFSITEGSLVGEDALFGEPSRDVGENVGTYSINQGTVIVNPAPSNYNITWVSADLTINQKELTITADNKGKVYGDSDPTFTVTYDGFVGGDNETLLTGTLEFTRETGEDIGTYLVTPFGLSSTNYNISYVGGFLTISQKVLTITSDDKGKVYGDSDPTFTATYEGFVGGDNETVLTGTLDFTRETGEDVGTYLVTPFGLSSTNYNISFVDGTLTISQAALTITADDQTKPFGQQFTFLGTEFTANGLVFSDYVNSATISSLGADAGAVAGTYNIVISDAVGDGMMNYNITYVEGNLTVTSLIELSISGLSAHSKVYDGNTTATISDWGTLEGVIGEDDVSFIPSNAQVNFSDRMVGVEKIVTVTEIELVGLDASKYTIGAQTTMADIYPKDLFIVGSFAVDDKYYDGTTNATIFENFLNVELVIDGDDVTLSNVIAEFDNANAASNINVSVVDADLTGTDINNYMLSFSGSPTTTATILPMKITIYPDAGQSKTYGDADPVLYFSNDELIGTDFIDGSLSRNSGENVGEYAYILGTLYAGSNYLLETDLSAPSFFITPRPLTITANDIVKPVGMEYVFDGNEFTNDMLSFSDEIIGVFLSSDGALVGAEIGTYQILIADAVIENDAFADVTTNYNITYTSGIMTVTDKTPVSLTNLTVSDKVYDGFSDATVTAWGDLVGVEGGDDVTLVTTNYIANFSDKHVGIDLMVTVSGLSLAGVDAEKYIISEQYAFANITARQITITLDEKTKTYGETDPSFTYTVDGGIVGSDVLTGEIQRIIGEDVGIYSIYQGSLTIDDGYSSVNYDITFVGAELTITPAVLYITAIEQSKFEGEADPELTYEATGFMFEDDIYIISGSLSREAGEAPGSYSILKGTLFAGNNYFIEFTPGLFTIYPQALSNEAEILSFYLVEQISAPIINSAMATVDIEVQSGTDVTSLAPIITISEGATILPESGVEVDFTEPVTYFVFAEDSETIKQWLVTVTVAEINTFSVTLLTNPEGIGNIMIGAGEYEIGQDVIISTNSVEGYDFIGWTGSTEDVELLDDPTAMVTSFYMPERNVLLVANFEEIVIETYTLTLLADPAGAGEVSGAGEYPAGEEIFIEAFENEGFVFVSWKNDLGMVISEEPSFVFIMPESNATLTANFQLIEYTVSATIHPEFGGLVTGLGTYYMGDEVTLVASPEEGYVFSHWSDYFEQPILDEFGDPVGPTYVFEMPADNVHVNAYFEEIFVPEYYMLTLIASPTEGGEVYGDGEFLAGEEIYIEAIPNDGYLFVSWTNEGGTVISFEPSFIYFMPEADVLLTANFEPVPPGSYVLTLLVEPEGAGLVTGAGTYDEEVEVEILATPNEGYSFLYWTYLGSEISWDPYFSFTMPSEDLTLTAHFQLNEYIVSVTIQPENAGYVDGLGTYFMDDEVILNALPESGFEFSHWSDYFEQPILDEFGDPVGPTYVFTMPADNVHLNAHFEFIQPETHTLTILVQGSGSVNVNGEPYFEELTFEHGSMVELEAFGENDWFFDGWSGDLTSFEPFEVIVMDSDKVITASFVSVISICVTNDFDEGEGSLRWAISEANQSQIPVSICFNIEESDVVTIYEELYIYNRVIINGLNLYSGNIVTVQVEEPGVSEWRVFNIDAPSFNVSISNMTIYGGNLMSNQESGGAIFVSENTTVNLENIYLSQSKAFKGGGIFTKGLVTITNSFITTNHAQVFGGGIYNHGYLSLYGSSVTSNSIDTGNPGKGIFTSGGSLLVDGSLVKGNSWGSKEVDGFDLSVGVGLVELVGSEVGGLHLGSYTDEELPVKNGILKQEYEGYDIVLLLDNSTIDDLLAFDYEATGDKSSKAGFAIGGYTGQKGDGGSIGNFIVSHEVDILGLDLITGQVSVENGDLALTETALYGTGSKGIAGVEVHNGTLTAGSSSIQGEGEGYDVAVSYGVVTLIGSSIGDMNLGIAGSEGTKSNRGRNPEGYEAYDIVLLLDNANIDSILAFDEEATGGKSSKAGFAIGGYTGQKGDGGSIGNLIVSHEVDILGLDLITGQVSVENGDLALTETALYGTGSKGIAGVEVHNGTLTAGSSSIQGEGEGYDVAVSYGVVTLIGSSIGEMNLGIAGPEGTKSNRGRNPEGYEAYDIVLLLDNANIDSILAFDEEATGGKSSKAGFAIGGYTGQKGDGGSIGNLIVSHEVDILGLDLITGQVSVENGDLALTETALYGTGSKGIAGVEVHNGTLTAGSSSIQGEGEGYDVAVSYGVVTLIGSSIGDMNLGIAGPEGTKSNRDRNPEGYEAYDIVLLLDNANIDSILAFDEEGTGGKSSKAGFAIGGYTGQKGDGGSIGSMIVSHEVDILGLDLTTSQVSIENGDLGLIESSLANNSTKEGSAAVEVHVGGLSLESSSILNEGVGYDVAVSYGVVTLIGSSLGDMNLGITGPEGTKSNRSRNPEGYEAYDIVLLLDNANIDSILAFDEEGTGGKSSKAGFAIGGYTGQKGDGGSIGNLIVSHEVDILGLDLTTSQVSIENGDLGLIESSLANNSTKEGSAAVEVHVGGLSLESSSILNEGEGYDVAVSYGVVTLIGSSLGDMNLGITGPEGTKSNRSRNPEGYEAYDIVLLLDNANIDSILAFDEEGTGGKSSKAGFAIGGYTGQKGDGGSIGNLIVSHEVDILGLDLTTVQVSVENGDLGLIESSLANNSTKEGSAAVEVHVGGLSLESSSLLNEGEGYDVAVSYGVVTLIGSSIGDMNLGIAGPEGTKSNRSRNPEGYEAYDIVLLLDNANIDSILAFDEEGTGGKSSKAGFAIGGYTGQKTNGGSISDFAVSHEVDILGLNLNTGKITVTYGDLGLYGTALTSTPSKGQPSKVFIHRGSLKAENSSIFGSTEDYDISVSQGSVMLNSSSINKVKLGAKSPNNSRYYREYTGIPEGYEDYDIVLLMDNSAIDELLALDEGDENGEKNKAGFAIGGYTGQKGEGGSIGNFQVQHEVDVIGIELSTIQLTVYDGDLGLIDTDLTTATFREGNQAGFQIHWGNLSADNSTIQNDGEGYGLAVSYGSISFNNSDVGSMHLGLESPEQNSEGSKYIKKREGFEEYDIVLEMTDSNIDGIWAFDQDTDATGFRSSKAGFAIGGYTGQKGTGNSVGQLLVEHELDLLLVSGDFNADSWQIVNSDMEVSRMGSTDEATITVQSIGLTGGSLITGGEKLTRGIIDINTNSVIMGSTITNGVLSISHLNFSGSTNLTMLEGSGKDAFIQVGENCAVTLSDNCQVNAGDALAFDIADGGSLIVESNEVVIIGNVKVQGLYVNQRGFVSAPIANVAIPSTGFQLETWSEPESTWNPNEDELFIQMKGYRANFLDQFLLVNFIGSLPPATQSIGLTNSNTSEINEFGWNLLGNPFTSALDFEVIAEGLSGIENVVYTYDPVARNYRVYQQGGLSLNGGNQLIPVARAFYMKANQENTSLGFGKGKTHNIPGLLKLKKAESKNTEEYALITVTRSNDSFSDQTLVGILPGESETFTSNIDVVKLFAPDVPQLYTLGSSNENSNDLALAINVIDLPFADVKVIPMNFKAAEDEQFTITATKGNSKKNLTVYLKDLVTNDVTQITNGGSYSFTSNQIEERFELFLEHKYSVNFSVAGGFGSLVAMVDGQVITDGTLVSGNKEAIFIATPSYGYSINSWTVNGIVVDDFVDNTLVVSGINEDVVVTVEFVSTLYTLTVAVEGEGTTMPAPGEYEYIEGTQVVLFASPSLGYQFEKWVVGEEEILTQAIQLTITGNISATAYFIESTSTQYTLTMSVVGQGTTTPPSGNHYYNEGTSALLHAMPAFGWVFDKWTIDGVDVLDNPTQISMNSDKVVVAHFIELPKYTLSISMIGSGVVLVNGNIYSEEIEIYQGQQVNISATPSTGWLFDGWTGDITSTNSAISFTMNSNTTLTATFTPIMHTLTVSVLGSGSVEVNGEAYTQPIQFAYGSAVDLEAIASTGWQFVGWLGDLISSNANESIVMTSNKTIIAQFNEIPPQQYTLTVAIVGEGSTVPAPGDYTYNEGAMVMLFASPASGFEFQKWVVGEEEFFTQAVQFTISSDVLATAYFVEPIPPQYTLTINIVGEGSVEVDGTVYSEPIIVEVGTTLNLEAIAANGWQFEGWSGDLVSINAIEPIIMNADKNITATFSLIPTPQFTLTITVVGEGFVNVEGEPYTQPIIVDEGTLLDLAALAAEGWLFKNWSGDVAEPNQPETTVTMDSDKDISAIFIEVTPVQYTLTVTIIGSGTVTVDGAEYTDAITVDKGTVLNLEAIAAEGWQFEGWSGDVELPKVTIAVAMFSDKAIIATFSEIVPPTYTVTFVVTDINLVPVEGATILVGDDVELTTDIEGLAYFNAPDGEYTFSVTRLGFELYESNFIVEGADLQVDVQLEPVGIIFNTLANIEVYPNPFSSAIVVRNAQHVSRVIITNTIGHKVLDVNLSGKEMETIQTHGLMKGVYLVTFINENGDRVLRRMVKQ